MHKINLKVSPQKVILKNKKSNQNDKTTLLLYQPSNY